MSTSTNTSLSLLGYACDLGASCEGAKQGPQHLLHSDELKRLGSLIGETQLFSPSAHARGLDAAPLLHEINTQLASTTHQLTRSGKRFITIGGDHTSAIGTWSGAASSLANKGDLGLIWFDAHMDSHTPQTTASGNIHGMPLAVLLGHGDTALTQLCSSTPKIKPQNLCLIGVRSFEPDEQALLQQLNVRIFYMHEIEKQGIDAVLTEALSIATNGTAGFGISFDIDALDPEEAPGVGTPEPQGLHVKPLFSALRKWNNHTQLIGLEIAEFNPILDKNNATVSIIINLIETLFSTTNQ